MLVTLANLKTFLGISNSLSDAVLNLLIDQVGDYVEKRTNRKFETASYNQEEYDGIGSKELTLKHFPVLALSKLEHRKTFDNTNSWEDIDGDDYWVNNDTGVITKTTRFHEGTKNYRATYTAGYAVVPYSIQWAVMTIISYVFNTRKMAGLKAESLGDHSITFEDAVQRNQDVQKLLNQFRDKPLC